MNDTETVVEDADYRIFGLTLFNIFKIVAAIGIFVASVYLRRVISQTAMYLIKLAGAPKVIEENAKHILALPLSFLTVFAGFYISAILLELPPELDHVISRALQSVVNLALFWFAFQFVDPIANIWMATSSTHHNFGEEIKEIFCKILKTSIAVVGFLAIMEIWGINVLAFLTGLGLVGMAVALAAQDTVKNLFGSFVIIADRIFHKGDFVVSAGVTGTIEHFGIRVTQIRKLDSTLVWVPNATLAGSTIQNISKGTRREISWSPQLAGNTSQEQIEDICNALTNYLKDSQDVENVDSRPLVHVSDVSDGAVTLMIYFHVKMMPLPEHLKVRERVSLEFRRIVRKHNASFAVPMRNVILHK